MSLINRHDAIEAIFKVGHEHIMENVLPLGAVLDYSEAIKALPIVDAVEVVRCKDCRYYNTTNCCDGCGWCERSGMDRGSWDNWFCADGAHKEGE